MTNLPKGWATASLGEIRSEKFGAVDPLKTPDREFELYSVPAFPAGRPEIVRGREIGSTKQAVVPGTVLVCKINPRINRAWVVGDFSKYPKLASTEWVAFPPVSGIEPKYLGYFFRQHAFRDFLAANVAGVGGSLMRARLNALDTYQARIPPTGEQVRIAEKLDELLSDLDAGVARLERARANLKRYRAAVLKAAVEGRSTEKWRAAHPDVEPASKLLERILAERRKKWEEAQLEKYADKGQSPPKGWKDKYSEPVKPDVAKLPKLPHGWCWATLDQLAEIGTGATPLRSEQRYWREGSIAWVTSAAVNEPYVRGASELVTPAALAETNLFVYPKHTLILAMYGEGKTRGKVSELLVEATTNQALAALVLEGTSSTCRQYVKTYLDKSYEDMRRIAAGGVQPNLNLGLIREMCIAIPPLSEQSEIVAMVDRLLSVQQRLVDESQKSALRAASLRQSILKRAFEGKLVPQDPKDEPASELLARIRAGRAGEGKGKRRTRGGNGGAV